MKENYVATNKTRIDIAYRTIGCLYPEGSELQLMQAKILRGIHDLQRLDRVMQVLLGDTSKPKPQGSIEAPKVTS